MTADGKLAPATRHFIPFGSKRDQDLLFELRSRADAVMSGARTIGRDVKLSPGAAKYRRRRLQHGLAEYNLRIVVSGSGSISPQADFFRYKSAPGLVLTTERISRGKLRQLEAVADEVKVCGQDEVDFEEALRWLRRKWNVKRLLCEGGGEVNEGLFRADLVDEVYVTLCPLIFGGRTAPTLSDGIGFERLADAPQFALKSAQRVGDELFLIYRRA
jgi:riboflavin-specific deaminase-like protein